MSDGGQDGSGGSIHLQRFAANGSAQGAEVQVNSYTLNTQNQPAVSGLADGGYVVAWTSGHDGSGSGVYAQRFNAAGQPAGGEFRVNTTITSTQNMPTVLGLADGSFVVAYESDYSNATAGYTYDVLGQRFAADGTPLGAEFTLNSNVNGSQVQPQLASLAGGGFVAAWTDTSGADGSGYGIVLQRFAADGSKLGSEIIANTTVAGTQQGADVVGLAGGGFVAVWHDDSTNSVLAQRFAADGSKLGAELLVSTPDTRADYNNYARVAALDTGGFVVTWDSTYAVGGSNYEVVAQQFSATGQRVDGVFVLNQRTASTQIEPDVVGLAGGNFVAAWSNYDAERRTDNSYGVFHRVFGTPGSVASSAAPVLVDLADSVTFDEALVNAGGQLIDASAGLSDADSANFDGGRLWVSVINGYPHDNDGPLAAGLVQQDVLGIRSVGTGAGQVSVSGSTVSYGGVAIGVIELGGAAGADLVLRFNASATSAAVEAVIESLTYANTSSAPSASRVVSISVSDGDGGTSDPRLVTVNVTPQADGPQPLFGNEVVNTFRPDTQGEPATAALTGGGYVTVWTSQGQDGSQGGVFGQRYTAAGERVGPEFQVNTQTLQVQDHPKVVGLAGGGFVVAWESQNQDGSSTGLYGQRFGADGAPAGSEFRINTTTDNEQSQVSLAALPGGGFVATWYSYYHEGTYYQIVAQRFDAANVPVGPEWTVNTDASSSYQAEPAVAAAADGSFLIVWRSDGQDGSGAGVYGQRFAANGSAQGSEFRVNSYTDGSQYQPDVAALAGGGYIVVWHSDSQDGNSGGVYGQRLNASGAPVGPEFRIHADIVGNQHTPSVTALPGGGFAVAWIDNGQAWLQQFAADGTRLDGELRLDTLDSGGNVSLPQVTALANGSLVATWGDYVQAQVSYEVVQQLLANPATTTRQSRPVITDLVDSITLPENLVNAAAQLIDASIDLADADSANFDGGQLWVSVISGYGNLEVAQLPEDVRAQDQLGLRSTGDGPGQVRVTGSAVSVGGVVVATVLTNGSAGADLVLRFNAQATPAAVEAVVEALTYANTASNPVGSRAISISLSDGDGATSEPQVVTVNVTPEADGAQALFGNELVNTYAPDTQNLPAITRLADGGYVIVWTSQGQDGWGTGVHAQRFDANGVPVGSEFQANTYTPYDQVAPTAAGLASGGFVLMWTSQNQDGSGSGVYGQRFDANGVPAGAEFLVNTGGSSNQSQVDVAALAGGGFVATWYADFQDGTYYNVYAQRFDANGAKQGSEFVVNDTSGGETFQQQHQPKVAALPGGGFVIVWQSEGQDGNSTGIYGQRYAADGSSVGGEFQVNSYTPSTQSEPDVVALTGGGFVVVWRSEGQDGNSGGVFGQRYGSNGAPVGSEFRINTHTLDNESNPAVTALSHGGFAVTYQDGNRISVQQFDAAGRPLDNETRVDTADNNNAHQPAIAGLGGGAFVVAWTDYDYQSGQYQIYQQVFGNPALLTRQANPQLVDVTPSVTFAENLVNAVPQLIDPGVGLIDTDSANFDGGLLEVNYLTDYGAQDQLGLQSLDNQDQLGIRHEGLGAGQVGVVGSVVSFSGVAIGQIVSAGANGDKLSVRFNANASVEAVEQVIENLTYANTVSNPIASRTVSIRVTDGDGGASAARAVTINVTPQIDGAVRFGLEQTVNTTRAGQQVESDIARLADGGYVVVWTDQGGADGSSHGVYGQRYDANDNPAGAQFRIPTTTAGQQENAQVVGLAGGGHVVVWQSQGQDGSGWGVYGQRFNANGSAAGGEFRVNTLTTSNQVQPALAATADGGFIVAWHHDSYSDNDTEYSDVFFQRYGANGTALGGETKANPGRGEIFRYQSEPALAVLQGGSFVVVWTDNDLDGSSYGVFGQRFSAAGVAQGSAFAVNGYTDSQQQQPAITALKDGGFLVTWQSYQQDLSGWGVYAQRFDATGTAVGAEFRVNTTISSNQYDVDVTALENGGWVVAWYGDNGGDVYLQQYNAAGQAVDGETQINGYEYSTQQQPAIASMADGGFVVSWSSYIASGDGNGDGVGDGGNDTYEIRLQRFSNTAPQVSDVIANGQEDTPLVLGNAVFEAGFADVDGQTLQSIRITTLPGEGTLRLNGTAVVAGQEITLAQLQAGQLTYQGNADWFGADQFRWTGSDGVAYASTPVLTTINLANVNDGPRLEAGANDTANEGVWFNHSITLGDPDPEGHLLTIDWGDGQAPQVFTVGNTPNHSISHYFADNGSYTVQVRADDQRGLPNSVATDSFQVVVANVAPTLTLFGNANAVQGQPYVLDLGTVVDPGADTVTQYRIDWGDGTPLQVVAAADLPANRELQHTYANPGTPTIRVALQDEDGVFANAGSRSVNVVAPAEVITVQAGADLSVNEGTVFTRSISFTDPTDQAPAGRSYTVNWGDGQTSSGNLAAGVLSFNISHAYADHGGSYTVQVTVDDSGAQQGSDSFVVQVANVAPTVQLQGATSVAEGSAYTMTLDVVDPGTDTVQRYDINWGDGSPVQTVLAADLPPSRQVSHVYADGAVTRNINVSVVDEDGTWTNAGTRSVLVSNVAPVAAVTGANSVAEGASYVLSVGAITDPGTDTRTGYSIDWGD
ncbi:PKD domain-containing protein, partial [Aquincola tertiaricarbonis]|uniref:PKD domain-containing protein n=1 Tax=Aquincola tertiaricarbonis TaxID=391953 RepID=UPI0018DE23BA